MSPQEKPTAPTPGGSLHVQKHPLPVHVVSAKYTCVCCVCAKSVCWYTLCMLVYMCMYGGMIV